MMVSFEIGASPNGNGVSGPAPIRLPSGELAFSDVPAFRPNLTPEQVLRAGAFGGGYFRNIHSTVTGESYRDAWRELPPEWIDGLDLPTMVASCTYRNEVNKYGVDCGGKADKSDTFGLRAWESAGWMHPQDPCVVSCCTKASNPLIAVQVWLVSMASLIHRPKSVAITCAGIAGSLLVAAATTIAGKLSDGSVALVQKGDGAAI